MNVATVTHEKRADMPRTVAVLPEGEQDALRVLRESGNLPALRRRVLALRRAQWPLRAIGDPLGAPRSTVRMWETGALKEFDERHQPQPELPAVPECPRAERNRGERTIRMRMDVPPEDRDELKELAVAARSVRGRTPKDAPARIAADKLDAMIESYIERDVPVKRIATHMGVTPRAVAARHERYIERKKSHDAD